MRVPIVGILLGAMCALFWIVLQVIFSIGHMVVAMILERRKRRDQTLQAIDVTDK